MSIERNVRQQLQDLGLSKGMKDDIEALGIELTICQFIVVVLSIMSVVFLFAPLFFLRDIRFMVVFFGISSICLFVGVWFWVKKSEICEHPEEYS